MKFAAAGFIVPFFFVCNPALLFEGPWIEILRAVVTNSIGVVALVASMEGYFLRTATWLERVLVFAAALLQSTLMSFTDIIGLDVLAVALSMQMMRTPRPAAAGGAST